MHIEPLLLLTIKKIRQDLSFRLSTFSLLIQPILWLSVFLFLRKSHVSIEINNVTIRYIDFLVIGIVIWRIVSFILGKLSGSLREEATPLRSIITAPEGEKILLWSSIASTVSVAIIIGVCTLATATLIYDFSIFLNQIVLAAFVFVLIIIAHLGISIIFISFPLKIKDVKSIGFLSTTIFGLLSGVFFPVEFFPFPFNYTAYILPLTQGLALVRELLLFPEPLHDWNLLYILLVESILLYILGLKFYHRSINSYRLKY